MMHRLLWNSGGMALILTVSFLWYTGGISFFSEERASPFEGIEILQKNSRSSQERKAAKDIFKKILEKEPGNPTALFGLGWALHLEGDELQALNYYRKAEFELRDYLTVTLYNQGLIFEKNGELEEALNTAKMALAISPNHQPSLTLSARVEKQIVERQ